jgi:hypothetical protein
VCGGGGIVNLLKMQGGSNMTGTNSDLFTHKSFRLYSNHRVYQYFILFYRSKYSNVYCAQSCFIHVPDIFQFEVCSGGEYGVEDGKELGLCFKT